MTEPKIKTIADLKKAIENEIGLLQKIFDRLKKENQPRVFSAAKIAGLRYALEKIGELKESELLREKFNQKLLSDLENCQIATENAKDYDCTKCSAVGLCGGGNNERHIKLLRRVLFGEKGDGVDTSGSTRSVPDRIPSNRGKKQRVRPSHPPQSTAISNNAGGGGRPQARPGN